VDFLRRLVLQGKKNIDDSSRLDVADIARVPGMLLVGLRTYQHPGTLIYAYITI